jgi:hypothetical protein
MKRILLFLFFTCSVYAHDLYILPDDYDEVIYLLSKKIESAKEEISLITDKLDNYKIKRALVNAAKKGVKILFISANNTQKNQLALYKNIQTKDIHAIEDAKRKGSVSMSIFIIDNSLTCKLSTSLTYLHMRHDIALFSCTHRADIVKSMSEMMDIFEKRSGNYLKY